MQNSSPQREEEEQKHAAEERKYFNYRDMGLDDTQILLCGGPTQLHQQLQVALYPSQGPYNLVLCRILLFRPASFREDSDQAREPLPDSISYVSIHLSLEIQFFLP